MQSREMSKAFIVACLLIFILVGAVAAAITVDNTMWVEYLGNPVFDPVAKAYYPCVIYDAGTYEMWYATATGIAYASSSDGISWVEVAACTGLQNPNHCWVVKTGSSNYEIWYWDTSQLYSIGAIRHADSSDGINWINDAAITQPDPSQPLITPAHPYQQWNRGSYGPCTILFDPSITVLDKTNIMNNRYVMYYDGTNGGDEFIGVAGSLNGEDWVGNPTGMPVLDHAPSASGNEYISRCTVLKDGGVYRMWFSYGVIRMHDGIGYAESTDGILWEEDPNNPIFHKNDGVVWRSERTYSPSVLKDGSTYKMWFTGKDATGNYAIGYATLSVPPPVGGIWVPTNKTELLAPWITLASLLTVAAISAVYVKNRKKKQN